MGRAAPRLGRQFAFRRPSFQSASVTSPRPNTLSKSDFKLARTCATKLYYKELKYPDTLAEDEYLDWLAEGGYMTELLAKQQFPEGVTLEYGKDPKADAAETMRRLAGEGDVTLFEATLLHGLRLARVDILRRSARGFDLYEVKSSVFDPEDAEKRIAKTGSAFRNIQKPAQIHSGWLEYLEDVTYQVTILKDLFPGVPVRAHLILLDKGKVAQHEGMALWFKVLRGEGGRLQTAEFIGPKDLARRDPITSSHDVTDEVASLEPGVREATAELVASLEGTLTRIAPTIGGKCKRCEYRVPLSEPKNGFLECWGERGRAQPHVLDLYSGREFRDELFDAGIYSWHEITPLNLAGRSGKTAAKQQLQITQVQKDEEWVDRTPLASAMAGAKYPLHFVDFEAAGIAVPHHKGMRPYQQLTFQWSCHTLESPGAPLRHREFLNTDNSWPNERFARELRGAVGDTGTLLVWSHFEGTALKGIADDLTALGTGDKELAAWLRSVAVPATPSQGRVLDMLKLCREHYYHPLMGASYSIKAVLDALWRSSPEARARFEELEKRPADPDAGPYASLPPALIGDEHAEVAEGTGAIRAYFRMAYGWEREDPVAAAQWANLLRQYCRLDTLAMVLIWEHWQRVTAR